MITQPQICILKDIIETLYPVSMCFNILSIILIISIKCHRRERYILFIILSSILFILNLILSISVYNSTFNNIKLFLYSLFKSLLLILSSTMPYCYYISSIKNDYIQENSKIFIGFGFTIALSSFIFPSILISMTNISDSVSYSHLLFGREADEVNSITKKIMIIYNLFMFILFISGVYLSIRLYNLFYSYNNIKSVKSYYNKVFYLRHVAVFLLVDFLLETCLVIVQFVFENLLFGFVVFYCFYFFFMNFLFFIILVLTSPIREFILERVIRRKMGAV